MENEKRLIDANELVKKLQEAVAHKGMGAAIAGILIRYIEKLPTVDAVEVVRCKDCKHYGDSPYDNGDMMCDRWGEWIFPNGDDFCSCGERKKNG